MQFFSKKLLLSSEDIIPLTYVGKAATGNINYSYGYSYSSNFYLGFVDWRKPFMNSMPQVLTSDLTWDNLVQRPATGMILKDSVDSSITAKAGFISATEYSSDYRTKYFRLYKFSGDVSNKKKLLEIDISDDNTYWTYSCEYMYLGVNTYLIRFFNNSVDSSGTVYSSRYFLTTNNGDSVREISDPFTSISPEISKNYRLGTGYCTEQGLYLYNKGGYTAVDEIIYLDTTVTPKIKKLTYNGQALKSSLFNISVSDGYNIYCTARYLNSPFKPSSSAFGYFDSTGAFTKIADKYYDSSNLTFYKGYLLTEKLASVENNIFPITVINPTTGDSKKLKFLAPKEYSLSIMGDTSGINYTTNEIFIQDTSNIFKATIPDLNSIW